MTPNFLYKHILTQFGCPLDLVTNQGIHFINDDAWYLIDHFILKHINFVVYYPQEVNGQAKNTNKVFGTLLTK
jgi:hypothetical protein